MKLAFSSCRYNDYRLESRDGKDSGHYILIDSRWIRPGVCPGKMSRSLYGYVVSELTYLKATNKKE